MSQIKRGQIEEWDIERLSPCEHNAKLHPDSHVGQIADSIGEFTFLDPIQVDEKGEILAGHGRLLAARKRGDRTVPVIQVTGLTDAQKVAYRLAHNKLTMNTGFDPELLKIDFEFLQDEGFDLDLTGFDELELSFLDEEEEESGKGEGGSGEDDFEPPEKIVSRVKLGEIWQLGRHKIACGDSTIESNVRALLGDRFGDVGMVWADPPYGYSYSSNMRTKSEKFDVIINDDKILGDFIYPIQETKGWVLICTAWKVLSEWLEASKPLGQMNNLIVWDKGGGGMGDLTHSLLTDYELIFAFGRGTEIKGKRIGSVWGIGKDRSSEYVHPTQKPVELLIQAFETFTSDGCLIFDPFLGSAPSIIAAQKMEGDRTVYGFELSIDYCEVIIQRWEKFTGEKAELIGRLDDSNFTPEPSEEELEKLGF